MADLYVEPHRTKVILTRLVDGRVDWQDRIDPVSAKSRHTAARHLGVEEPWLMAVLAAVREDAKSRTVPIPVVVPEKPVPAVILVRRIDATRETAVEHPADPKAFLDTILPTVPVDHVVEWQSNDDLCCLDIDYHGTEDTEFRRRWLDVQVTTRVAPKPYCWHFSRSGGLHLFYLGSGVPEGSTAEELAAVAALRFRSIDGSAGLELKRVVRGPGASPVYYTGGIDLCRPALSDWFGSGDDIGDEARDSWLRAHDMECGRRYTHDRCPIHPSDDAGEKRSPVVVSEGGIYCFVCEAKGRGMGHRKAGFAPWPAIVGAPSSGDLGDLIRNLVHWGHAKWVLSEKYGMPPQLAKLAYRAALKAAHEGTPKFDLIPQVFRPQLDPICRVNDVWYSIETNHAYQSPEAVVAALPVTLVPGDDGKARPDPVTCTHLAQPMDLTRWGYRNIECIHGQKLAGLFQVIPGGRTQVPVCNPNLIAMKRSLKPQYVPPAGRMSEDEAWARIEAVAPRIDRTLIKTCICAFATSQETRSGLLPLLFVSGPSGAAKTATCKIAAGIFGCKMAEAVYDTDTNKFRGSLFLGAQSGPAVMINEILKDAARSRERHSAKDALDPFLNLTADSYSHQLYIGPVKFGRVPALIFTEPRCPYTIREEQQIARRIRHHRVEGRKEEWAKTIAAAGIPQCDLQLLRLASDSVNAACDAIVSYVADQFFATPMSWDEQADLLGVPTIEKDDKEFFDHKQNLVEFFKGVCAAPALPPKLAKQRAAGFKQIARSSAAPGEDDPEDLTSLYTMFADAAAGRDWLRARRLTEKDWSSILKTDVPVQIDMTDDGVNVYVRFRTGPATKPHALNGDIVPVESLK